MALSVYTVRMLSHAGVPGPWSVTVPAGKRWIVRNIDCVNATTSAGAIVVGIAGVQIINSSLPATTGSLHLETRQVALPGEILTAQTITANIGFMITGYEFDNTVSGRAELEGVAELLAEAELVDPRHLTI